MWSLKYNPDESIYETETDSQIERLDLLWPRERGKEGLGVWN